MRLPVSGDSADWHDDLDDVFQIMDAQLSFKRGYFDQRPRPGAAASANPAAPAPESATPSVPPFPDSVPAPAPAAPPSERRKSPPPDRSQLHDNLAPAAAAVSRTTDQLSAEALDAIATRVAEILKASLPFPQPPPGVPERRAPVKVPPKPHPLPARGPRPGPMITIRFRMPFFSARRKAG